MKKINVAILGATGAVGETMINILSERNFPIENLYPLASERSKGKIVHFRDKDLPVQEADTFDFGKTQLALFSAGSKISKKYAPIAVKAGCTVIDNTSCFRYEPDVPLVVPEINPEKILELEKRKIIANPNCSTIQMVVALNAIQKEIGIERINIATYQAVSGTGKSAISELITQSGELLQGRKAIANTYPQQIAFNVLPHIDEFQDNGFTKEEMKLVWESRKIWDQPNLKVNATAVRVPVLYGHSEAIHIETKQALSVTEAKQLLSNSPGVELIETSSKDSYPTPSKHAAGKDAVYVGRLRKDLSHKNGLNMWVVSDNLRKGAALNSVQIAEMWFKHYTTKVKT